MAQDHSLIECFCEECYVNFWSYIGKDICPLCEKLIDKKQVYKIQYEKIKKHNKWSDE